MYFDHGVNWSIPKVDSPKVSGTYNGGFPEPYVWLFWGWVFSYISRIHTAYKGEYRNFRHLKSLVIDGSRNPGFVKLCLLLFRVTAVTMDPKNHGTNGIFTAPWMLDFYVINRGKFTRPMDGMGFRQVQVRLHQLKMTWILAWSTWINLIKGAPLNSPEQQQQTPLWHSIWILIGS